MKRQLEEIQKNLKQTLLEEVQEQNTKLDEKLNMLIGRRTWDVDNSNWNVGNVNDNEAWSSSETTRKKPVDLRVIIKEAENDKLIEENEKKNRACNIIIHGVPESAISDQTRGKQHDDEYVTNFISSLALNIKYKTMYRLGKRAETNEASKRPIKIIMNNDADKDRIMENLKHLKGKEEYKGISVKDDYTIEERNLIKEWNEKAKLANTKEPADSKHEWKVRGTPKNGMLLKRFQKRVKSQQM